MVHCCQLYCNFCDSGCSHDKISFAFFLQTVDKVRLRLKVASMLKSTPDPERDEEKRLLFLLEVYLTKLLKSHRTVYCSVFDSFV